jgi:hypothetical protein
VRPQVEALESRLVPYALSGGAWPNPQVVTISFVPDGTQVGVNQYGIATSNLFSTFNTHLGSTATWERQILLAAQTWASVANINFSVVGDNGTPVGQGPDQQGDPNMGDIRIGGFNLGNGWLAQTFMPPPLDNYSIAGDIQFNTAIGFHIGSTYDLYSVAAHEFGHALGLEHSPCSTANVMYPSYNGVKKGLSSDDIAGIEAIYGARQPDVYNSNGASDGTLATAANLTSLINPALDTALVQNLDVTSTTQSEYYTFTAPANAGSSLTVTVQSAGLSLFTPQATLYAANGTTVLATATSAGSLDGGTLTLTATNVTPGEQFYVKVSGADSTVFSTGEYALTLNFGSGSPPAVPIPVTTLANGNPLQGGGAQADSMPAGTVGGTSATLPPVAAVTTTAVPGSTATVLARQDASPSLPVTAAALPAFLRLDQAQSLSGPRGDVSLASGDNQAAVPPAAQRDNPARPASGSQDQAPARPRRVDEGVTGSAAAELWVEVTTAYFAEVAARQDVQTLEGPSAEQPPAEAAPVDVARVAGGAAVLLGGAGLGAPAGDPAHGDRRPHVQARSPARQLPRPSDAE